MPKTNHAALDAFIAAKTKMDVMLARLAASAPTTLATAPMS